MTAAEAAEEISTSHMKISTVAELLGVDAASVYRLWTRGALGGVCIDGVRFVSIESLEKYVASRRSARTA